MGGSSALDGTPILSAELHYFRAPPDDWLLLLVRLRQMGANAVSTYVPWCWHEPQPGLFDFTGATDPRRDLVRFVHLCDSLGLRLILKPGPFVDAELLGGGIPLWLLQNHPEIHARRADGDLWRHSESYAPRACYLHPIYLAAARRWIDAFSTATLPFQHPSGPIIALQADNETPGDGMLPADAGLDPRLRLDYNPYVVDHLWRAFASSGGTGLRPAPPEPPRVLTPPSTLADLERYLMLETFTDWFYARALAAVVAMLREAGWNVPVFHNLLAAPWHRCSALVDLPAMAHAAGWLGFNVDAEDVDDPFVGRAGYALSFEEYIHYGFWRPRLMAALSRRHPVFVSEISAAQDFCLATPLMGGAQAINVYAAVQSRPDNPAIGAWSRWAMDAPVRPDGGVRRQFWNAKTLLTLLGAAGSDVTAAAFPADVAIGYSHLPERVAQHTSETLHHITAGCDIGRRAQALAQRLVRAGIPFHVIDVDTATQEELAAYPLLLVPSASLMARATQHKLATCSNLALVGHVLPSFDEHLAPCDVLHFHERSVGDHTQPVEAETLPVLLPDDVESERIVRIIEQRGGYARYGWADARDVDVTVRHGDRSTIVCVANRRPDPYRGTLTYRCVDGSLLHIHVSIGGLRIGLVMMNNDEVVGCAIGGDASEGPWFVRGMHSSIMFSGGAGVVAPCGDGVRLSAVQSGRFQLRRLEGWNGLMPYRLLLSGDVLPALAHIEGTHLTLPYVGEDEHGVTDSYLLLPAGPAPDPIRADLRALLLARAQMLRAAAIPSPSDEFNATPSLADASRIFVSSAEALETLADQLFTLDEYAAAWKHATAACEPAVAALVRDLARVRSDRLIGALDEAQYATLESRLSATLEGVARASLRYERE
ncbi:MAG: beta-galactosidase [Roseiflexus sp.]|nr:beta-galactosidase [Roseiflexus sp.]